MTSAIALCKDVLMEFFYFCCFITVRIQQNHFPDLKTESNFKTILTDIYIEAAARPIASRPSNLNFIGLFFSRNSIRGMLRNRGSGFRERKKLNEESDYYSLFGQTEPYCASGRQRISPAFYRIRR